MPKESRRKFEYAGRSDEDVSRRAKQSSARYDSIFNKEIPYFSPKAGENCIRILPWIDASHPKFKELTEKWDNHWGISVLIHRNVGPDKGTYLCLDKMLGQPCPVCDVFHAEEAEALKLSDRVLAWIIDRNNEKAGPQLWNMPLGTSKDISLASELRGGKGALLIDNPDEGHDVYFDREGEKERTRYKQFEVVKEPSYINENEDKQDAWLDFVMENCLPDLLLFRDAEYLEKLLSGRVARDDDGEEGEERGSRRSSRKGGGDDDGGREARPSRRGRGEEEPEGRSEREDAGEGEGEGREEFTRPARRGRGSADDDGEPEPERGNRRGRSEPEPTRGSRRGRGAEREGGDSDDGGTEEAPERGRSSRGRSSGGGKTERYRGRGEEADQPDDDDDKGKDDDVDAAKSRLRSVGRRR